ncbi:MAG: endo-1,4-beta-xylanase, partial [Armatimonadetes bacterium]|nr:endo-1,4-beta-xylanase [Armatimonadota bacterium]
MERRSFLKLVVSASAAVTLEARWMEIESAQDEAVLDGVSERIERHRKGDVNITVRTQDGKPVRNAELSFEQQRHSFLFGSNIFRFGRIKDVAREEAYLERFAALLNYATIGFYWASYEPVRGKPNYEYTNKVLEWCERHKIVCKGHPLAWDHPASSPDGWLPDDLSEVERLSTERVHEIVKRYSGRIDIWDVVNEPTDLLRFKTKMNALANKLGAILYTAIHLRAARKANPKATLLVNDYRTDDAYFRILQQLRDENGKWLFDAIGIQSHMHGGVWSPARIWSVCERFSKLGMPLHFTETTILSGERIGGKWSETTKGGEERQAEATVRFYTVLFSHHAVQALS